MANVQSHVAPKGRKSQAAKPIPSKVMSVEDKHAAEELKLQGAPASDVQGVQAQPEAPKSDLPPEVIEQERREREERRAINPDQVHGFIAHNLIAPVVDEGADPLNRTPAQVKADFDAFMQEQAAKFAAENGIADPSALTQLMKGEAPQPPKMQKLTRNNITRPGPNTKTGLVWEIADSISASHQGRSPATIAEIKAHPSIRGMNDHTIKTQYARWRQYNGVTGRITAPVQAQQTVAPVWSVGFGAEGNFELPVEAAQPATAEPEAAAE